MPKAKKQSIKVAVDPVEKTIAISHTQEQPTPEPTATVPQTTAAPAAEPKMSKQDQAIIALAVGLKEHRQIEVTPEMITSDGKYKVVKPGETWPGIFVGPTGGYSVPLVRSYPKADVATICQMDERWAKQQAKDAKKTAQSAPAPTTSAPQTATA